MKPFSESTLTVISPVYRNESTLPELARQVFAAAEPLFARVEYVFVNDGSPDGSREVLRVLCGSDRRVRAINFARNFGQHTAIMAGLRAAGGDYVFVIDADLEESPGDLPVFCQEMRRGGHEIVVGRRTNRRLSPLRSVTSRLYTHIFNAVSDIRIIDNVTSMRLMTRRYVDFLTRFDERPFLGGIMSWIGVPFGSVQVTMQERAGSSYGFRRLLNHARAGIIGFSTRPLRLAAYFGLLLCGGSLMYAAWVLLNYVRGDVQPGFTTLVLLFTFLMGTQFIFIGLIGEYIGEIFLQTKHRPPYLIYDRFGFDD